jgi:hypothetical protein
MNYVIQRQWWRGVLLGIGLSLAGGQYGDASVITTATGGNTDYGYNGAQITSGTTPSLSVGDVMRGFIMFKNGFRVGSGPVFYDADGPIYGNIVFNNTTTSTIQLGSDMRLGTTGWFSGDSTNYGNISGAGRVTANAQGNAILMGGDQALAANLTITSTLIIDGCGHTLTVSANGLFTLANRSTLTLRNMDLVVSVTSLFAAGTAGIANYVGLENVNIFLTQNATIFGDTAQSQIMTRIQGFVGVWGPYRAYANSTRFDNPNGYKTNIAINQGSTLYIGPGTTLDLKYLAMPMANKIGLNDSTSVLWLDGCELYWGTTTAANLGVQLQRGTLLLDDKVKITDTSSPNNAVDTGFVLGDGSNSANDVDVRVLGGGYVVMNGAMKYNHS